jgi:acetyl esterase/lipase
MTSVSSLNASYKYNVHCLLCGLNYFEIMIKIIFSVLVLSILSACSDIKFAVVNAPQLTYDGQIIRNIAYGDNPRQKLDIYIPKASENAALPIIVFFHGGRWSFGSKDQYKFVGLTLSNMGYIVVLPNTRLYPEVKHPEFVRDGAAAVAWVYNNIAEYGGNNNLYLSGHSSGAHISALITADESYLKAQGLSTNIINAFAGISAPYDFDPSIESEDLRDMFGPPSQYPTMQVTTYVDGSEPPMLLLYTAEDTDVHIRNLELITAQLDKVNGRYEKIIYPNGNHIDAVGALSWVNPAGLPIIEDMDAFFKKYQ